MVVSLPPRKGGPPPGKGQGKPVGSLSTPSGKGAAQRPGVTDKRPPAPSATHGTFKKARTAWTKHKPEDFQQGCVVEYWIEGLSAPGRGIVKDAFHPLDEFWLVDEETKEYVRDWTSQDVKSFPASDLKILSQPENAAPPAEIEAEAEGASDEGRKEGHGASVEVPPAASAAPSASVAASSTSASAQPTAKKGSGPGGAMTADDWAGLQHEFSHLPPLMKDWIYVKSNSSGNIYFWNVVKRQAVLERPMPKGWVTMKSKSTGKEYYWHERTQTSQFDPPLKEL